MGVASVNHAAIAGQLSKWHVLPEPERLSELYFTDYTLLPKALKAGATRTVAFTVHSLEHQTTTYHYKLVAMLPDAGVEQPLGNGTFTLNHDESHLANTDIIVPTHESRIKVRVDLYYQGSIPGNTDQKLQTQSIDYWVAISGTGQTAP